jgi:hypothetical protein
VDIAQEVERHYILQRDAVEAPPVVIGMRHDRPCRDLQQQDQHNDEKILADLALTVRKRPEPCQHRIHRRIVRIVEPEFVDEQYQPEREEGEAEARPGPNKRVRCWRVADLRLVRPVLGPGPRCVRAAGNGGECAVDQEIGGLRRLFGIKAVGRCPACVEIGCSEPFGDAATQRGYGVGQGIRNSDLALCQVDMLKLPPHRIADLCLLLRRECGKRFAEARLRQIVLDETRQPNERPGCIILPIVGAHAVQAPVIHKVGFLESRFAGNDVGIRHHCRAGG